MESVRAATLGDLVEDGLSLFCWCNTCSHNAIIDAALLCRRLGAELPVPAVAARLRCGVCGGAEVAVRPAWPPVGQVTRHD